MSNALTSFTACWDNLNATISQSKKGDGTQSTAVSLTINDGVKTWQIPGKTGSAASAVIEGPQTTDAFKITSAGACGHAELAALHFLISAFCLTGNDIDTSKFDNLTGRWVDCSAKPICCRCAAVLGFLGFQAANGTTLKSRDPMGGTQWGASNLVKEFLELKGFPGTISNLSQWGGT